MIEILRDLRVINILAKSENDPNFGHESVNGVCLPCRPPTRSGDDNTQEPLRAAG